MSSRSDSPLYTDFAWGDNINPMELFSSSIDGKDDYWEDIRVLNIPDNIPTAVCSERNNKISNNTKRSHNEVETTEEISAAAGSVPDEIKAATAEAATKVPSTTSSKARSKKQKTDGVPCTFPVCQFPILVSNATNVGNTDEVTVQIDRFITEDITFNVVDHRNPAGKPYMSLNGKAAVMNYFESLLEIMPDIISEIRTLKRKPDCNIAYVHAVNGTISFPPDDYAAPHSSPLLGIMKSLMEQQIENHINFVRKHSDSSEKSVKKVEAVREKIMKKGLPFFVKLEINGNLYFDGTDGVGAVVHRFDIQHRIQHIKPSAYNI